MCRKTVIKEAFAETMIEYFKKTSLNGFRLLYYVRNRKLQSTLWFAFILSGIMFASYIVTFTLIDFLENPLETTITSKQHQIWNIPFPAVGLCSTNKISLHAVKQYAKKISLLTNSTIGEEVLLRKFENFGNYFDSDAEYEEGNELQMLLDETDVDQKGLHNVPSLLRRLAPQCEDLLLKCRWAGQMNSCTELFSLHATSIGFCCLFNYQRGFGDRKNFPLKYPQGIGEDSGLTLLLNASTKDYFLNDRSINGFAVQIFRNGNFPDPTTGTFDEVLVSSGEDVNVELKASSHVTSAAARAFSSHRRRCFFNGERTNEFNEVYTRKECLTKCKLKSILALCGCVPYYTPNDFIDTNTTVNYCTLAHAECLDTHRTTWSVYRPVDESIPIHMEQEFQDALSCPNCLPVCSYYSYKYQKLKSSLRDTKNLYGSKMFLQNIDDFGEISLLKIYFSKSRLKMFTTNVIYNWYQILATIGGVIGICIGGSLISFFELIYFLTFRFYWKCKELRSVNPVNKKEAQTHIPNWTLNCKTAVVG